MSYLAALRIHFAGQFQAAVSTVNNDPLHYDNATFKQEYWERGAGASLGWWNPRGNADWRLIGCAVTGASHADGSPAAAGDPVLSLLVADSDRMVPAKLADLDPEQQLVSTIWGLEVRICDAAGMSLVAGRFAPAPFVDIWNSAQGPGAAGDIGACAAYQSVLTDLRWGDVSGSPLLTELRAAATDGLLSIRFNVDGYNMSPRSPDFTLGRIVGTIGVASASEPRHFVRGRQIMALAGPGGGFFSPLGEINFCTAVVDTARSTVILDLGNALPTTGPGGPPFDLGTLTLGYVAAGDATVTPIGPIDYLADGWYEQTAGVVEVALTAAQLAAIAPAQGAQLALTAAKAPVPTLESPLYVRADAFVHRIDPGDTVDVDVYATQFGEPLPDATVTFAYDPTGLQSQVAPPDPTTSEPLGPLTYPAQLQTDAHGRATLTLAATDPGRPRDYLDGQLYGVRPALADQAPDAPVDPWNFISVLVSSQFHADDPVAWWGTPNGSLQPVFQQYRNLYPVMSLFLDLSDYDAVCANLHLLTLAFGLDEHDPNSMPVTRDLPKSTRAAILGWMNAPGPDGKPLLGTPPPPAATPAAVERAPAAPPPEADRGGKASAAARRRSVRATIPTGGRS